MQEPVCESPSARAVRESPLQEPLSHSARAPPREPRGDGRDGGDARTYGRQIPSARAPLREPLCKSPSARATQGRTGRRGRTDVRKTNPLCKSPSARAPLQEPLRESHAGTDG